MARMPGAVWRPIPVSSTRPKRRKGRGVCYHVAVSTSSSLFGYFSTADDDSHFYVAKDGTIEQYVDTELVAYANRDGNSSLISVETQGGYPSAVVEAEKWTDAQVASLAKIAKWAHDTEGVPLRLMQNSLATERGLGWHKLGCNPWRVSGGELWSSANGKVCPGLAKIAQMPEVLRRAQALANPTPAPKDDAIMAVTESDFNRLEAKVDRLVEVLLDREYPRTGTLESDTVQTARLRDLIRFADGNALKARRASEGDEPTPGPAAA